MMLQKWGVFWDLCVLHKRTMTISNICALWSNSLAIKPRV